MKRALHVESGSDHLNFYTLYDGCLMDCAMLNWCKVFGANSESSHWKILFPDRVDEVRILLISAFGDKLKYKKAHAEAINYRNKYVSHHSFNENLRPKNHPYLLGYRQSAHVLYELIFEGLSSNGNIANLPSPSMAIEEIERHWTKIVAASRAATINFEDTP